MSCCFSLWLWGTLTALIAWCIWYVGKAHPNQKICGVYSQPGKFYWLKVILFYMLMKFRKWKDARNEEKVRDHTKVETYHAGYGTKSKGSWEEMEKVQPLSDHFQAIDAIYFNGANSAGFQIISGTARRPLGVVNGFLIFRVPDLGTLVSPKFPDTTLFGGSDEHFGAEGIQYSPLVPMKHWKLAYDGNLKLHGDDSKLFKVKMRADWTSTLPHFDYDCMIPPWTMARAIALETWSREYFEMLKNAHQTHYEQHGNLNGEIEVDGTKYAFSMPSMRDHSYGVKREWKLLHRYMMHMFRLEDGRRFNIGIMSQPVTCSELEFGYMYEADGSLHALETVGPHLWSYGENGVLPTDYAIQVRATNGKEYVVQVQVQETQELFIGWEWEARIVERRCKFTVDGIHGFGISDCQYRNTNGRPEVTARTDPEWVKSKKPWTSEGK